MTVETTASRAQYDTNGTTGPWTVPFPFLRNEDLQVVYTDAAGVDTTLVLDVDFSVVGAGGESGTITTVVAYPGGGKLTVLRDIEPLQESDYVDGDSFPAETLERDLDRLTMLNQQTIEVLDRALVVPPSEVGFQLPPAAQRKGKLLGFDSVTGAFALVAAATGSILDFALQLASALGSSLIGFLQSGLGAVLRTLQDKGREIVSVTDFGAVGSGGDDTAVFTLAQASHSFIEVPAGLVCHVTAGLQYWKFFGRGQVVEDGQEWSLAPYPQTGAMGKFYVERTRGNRESAVGLAVTVNANVGQTRDNAQILATDDIGALAVRGDYDHVAIFASSYSYVPDLLDATSTYTATTVTNASIATLYATKKLKVGDYLLTRHATPLLGRVKSVSGTTATVVGGWYLSSTGLTATPANGTGVIVNPNNKAFGANIEVSATGNGTTTGAARCAGLEIGVTTATSGTPIAGTYGVDVVSRGSGYMDLGFRMRGKVNYAFFVDQAGGSALYGFRADGAGRGLSVVDATVAPIEIQSGGGANTILGVAPSGALTISPLNTINGPLALNGNGQTMSYTGSANAGYTQGMSGLATVHFIAKNTAQNRSINAAGTINANGADYAEYERNNGLVIAKGDVVGFKVDGTLTRTFADAIRFGIKSTDPALVGGDSWGTEEAVGLTRPVEPVFEPQKYDGPTGPGPIPEWMVLTEEQRIDWLAREAAAQNAMAAWQASVDVSRGIFETATMPAFMQQWATWNEALEHARQGVDRVAYSGKVPVNVLGATPGQYLVAVAAEDGSITAEPVPAESATFAQYQRAIGRVNRILPDGRAEVAVIIH